MSAIGDRSSQRQLREPVADAAVDVGVDDRLEVGARDAVREDETRQRRAIERAVVAEHARAEALDDRGEPWRAGRDREARQLVGVDGRDAQRREARQAIGLAGRDAAGQCGL